MSQRQEGFERVDKPSSSPGEQVCDHVVHVPNASVITFPGFDSSHGTASNAATMLALSIGEQTLLSHD